MEKRSVAAMAVLLGALAGACSEPTGPEIRTVSFCTVPGWVALKNEPDGAWRYLTVSATSPPAVEFVPAGRFSIAYHDRANERVLVHSMTVDELRDWPTATRTSCGRVARILFGSLSEVESGEVASFVSASGFAAPDGSAFQIHLPADPAIVLGELTPLSTGARRRIIIRRDVDQPAGSTMPLFDFASNEATAMDSATVSVPDAESYEVRLHFSEWSALLFGVRTATAGSHLFAVPEAKLAPDEYHTLRAIDYCPATSSCVGRTLTYRYRTAAPTSLTFGPMPAAGFATTISETPCRQARVEIPVQPEYSAKVSVGFAGAPNTTRLGIEMTRAFLGSGKATWTLEIPDLQHPDGSCLLDTEISSISAGVYGGQGLAKTGNVVRHAWRFVTPN